MQMASRIRRSWQALVDQLAGLASDDPRLLDRLREWLRTNPGGVSTKTAELLSKFPGVQLVLDREPQTLPVTRTALDALTSALRGDELPRDPEQYAEMLEGLCWGLAVFRGDDDCCSPAEYSCDGELELWTDGQSLVQLCTAWPQHCFDVNGRELEETPDGLRPANREEILAGFKGASKQLAGWRTP